MKVTNDHYETLSFFPLPTTSSSSSFCPCYQHRWWLSVVKKASVTNRRDRSSLSVNILLSLHRHHDDHKTIIIIRFDEGNFMISSHQLLSFPHFLCIFSRFLILCVSGWSSCRDSPAILWFFACCHGQVNSRHLTMSKHNRKSHDCYQLGDQ